MGFRIGKYAFNDCLAAETMIFSSLSGLMIFRSENRQMTGVISSIPISVHFSINHSSRSMFLVGAMAM